MELIIQMIIIFIVQKLSCFQNIHKLRVQIPKIFSIIYMLQKYLQKQ